MPSEVMRARNTRSRVFHDEDIMNRQIDRVQYQSDATCLNEHEDPPEGVSRTAYQGENNIERRLKGKSDGDDSVDGDHVICSHRGQQSHEKSDVVVLNGCVKQHKGNTLQELYFQQEEYDDDDDNDDSDWEPTQNHLVSTRWFCVNCTMANLKDVWHCDVCGEIKESDILKYGYFASPVERGMQSSVENEILEVVDSCKENLPLKNSTAIGFDDRMLLHFEVEMKSHPHPERPDRLRAIVASLSTAGIFPGKCFLIPPREITQEELMRVHSLDHVESVQYTSRLLSSYFTPDTYANEHSACAARLAAGLCADLASAIMSGKVKNGFALVRPPGHHAGTKQAMGFCLHNNAAIAALSAQTAQAQRVLIVDWDVHHGNGTQEIFEKSRSVLYISLHRHEDGRFYPGTGAADEVGIMEGEGYCVNIPWKRGGVGDNDYLFAFQHIVLPIALKFSPDLTIISAGFDAARGDPLGCCDVTPAGYAKMTRMLSSLSQGKLLAILEGGYNLRSISSSATEVVKVLLGKNPGCKIDDVIPSRPGLQTVLEVLKVQMKFWPILKSSYMGLQSQWDTISSLKQKKQAKKRRHTLGPILWKLGRRRLIYRHLLHAGFRSKHGSSKNTH
ncbi:Histone deacetylase 15 [Acorus calamus]|uniref:histone deacetylase n=1 Tax=Acorus calamus TaxID=4465 RepID=A0AAV9F860_ACOCL|nr:Histone deacetylase 15 [Acorus calamus]